MGRILQERVLFFNPRARWYAIPTVAKRIIGVCHLEALPGSPRSRLSMERIEQLAVKDARALARGGVDAVIVENFGDRPFAPSVGPETVAAMTAVSREIRRAVDVPLGINVLRNDVKAALAVAHAVGAEFIRVNVLAGVYVSGEGMLVGNAAEVLRFRKSLGSRVRIYADVLVKHAQPFPAAPTSTLARDTAYRALADALIVTGPETGIEPDAKTLQAVRTAVPDRPLFIGSGLTPDTIELLAFADGAIVGTSFKSRNRVDLRRVKDLVSKIRSNYRSRRFV